MERENEQDLQAALRMHEAEVAELESRLARLRSLAQATDDVESAAQVHVQMIWLETQLMKHRIEIELLKSGAGGPGPSPKK